MKAKVQSFNKLLFKNKKIQIKDTILVAGSPRSGTTWLMEILGTLPEYAYLFEPLNPIWFPESFEVGFRSKTHIKPESNWSEGEEYLKKIFAGQIANLPIKDNTISDILHSFSIKNVMNHFLGNKLIVKSTNMNRILPWITKRFQLKNTFFIIRHPCATIASQIKTGLCGYRPNFPPYCDIFPTIDDILNEMAEIDDFDSNLVNKLKNIKTKEEVLAASWCLDNYFILSHAKTYPLTTIIYEKLVNEGQNEIKRIFDSIDVKNIPKSAYSCLKKPSALTLKEDYKFINMPDQQLSKWKKQLSEKQIEKILKIVSYFDIALYSKKQ